MNTQDAILAACNILVTYNTIIKVFQNVKLKECKRVGRRVPSSKLVREVWWPAVKDPFFIREGGKSGGAGSGGGG